MKKLQTGWSLPAIIGLVLIVALATVAVTALLMNVAERKSEAKTPFVRLVEVDEDTTDHAVFPSSRGSTSRERWRSGRRSTCSYATTASRR